MRLVLTGTGASRGMALGRARLEHPSRYLVDERPLPEDEIDAEIERLKRAIELARDELSLLREKLHGTLAREVAEFIDAHSLMLADRELTTGIFANRYQLCGRHASSKGSRGTSSHFTNPASAQVIKIGTEKVWSLP